MLRPPRVGAYSSKYKKVEQERLQFLKQNRGLPTEIDPADDERVRELRRQANRRRE